MEGFVSFIAQLNSAKMVRARELLYQNKGKVEYLSSQDKTSIKVILILLDQMGTLVIKKLIPEEVAIEMYWDVVIKCWDASKSWIKKEEQERGGDQSADGARTNATKNGPSNKYDDYEFYPDNKPESDDYTNYHETLYENFKVLVYRCEKYCAERGLTRPVVY